MLLLFFQNDGYNPDTNPTCPNWCDVQADVHANEVFQTCWPQVGITVEGVTITQDLCFALTNLAYWTEYGTCMNTCSEPGIG